MSRKLLLFVGLTLPAAALAAPAGETHLPLPIRGAGVDHVPGDFPTLQAAIDHGRAPVIEVGPGRWAGATVTRKVRLVGEGATIVEGPRLGGLRVAFPLTAGASGTEITGFAFDCTGRGLDVGVYASAERLGAAPDRITVSRNTFRGCVQGVTNAGSPVGECEPDAVDGGSFWAVQDNVFDGFSSVADNGRTIGGIGVFLYNASYGDVIGNVFRGTVEDQRRFTTSGVLVAGCWDCTVALNDFQVKGGRHYWSAVSNLGFYQTGAAASRGLLLVDNDASADSAPHHDVSFRSIDSFDVQIDDNAGITYVDHTWCGDQELVTFGSRGRR